jgi:hypothetical protein
MTIHGHKQHWAQGKERKQTKWKVQLTKLEKKN